MTTFLVSAARWLEVLEGARRGDKKFARGELGVFHTREQWLDQKQREANGGSCNKGGDGFNKLKGGKKSSLRSSSSALCVQ